MSPAAAGDRAEVVGWAVRDEAVTSCGAGRPYAFGIQLPNRSLNRPNAKARRIVARLNHELMERRKVLA
jgi:hypothetical protein